MSDTKACPYCGEQVLAVAIKCKHCGSAIGPAAASAPATAKAGAVPERKTPLIRPGFAVAGALIIALLVGVLAYNFSRTRTISSNGFSDDDVSAAEKDIRDHYTGKDMTVVSVSMIRDTPTHMTGFVKVKLPLVGEVTKNCSATWGEGGRYIWECK